MSVSPSVPGPESRLEVEKTPNETIVHCSGRITSDTAALFQETAFLRDRPARTPDAIAAPTLEGR
jgi:hypothetical protein